MKFKRPLVLVLVLALAMSAVTGGTIAWFTDEVTSANNVIQSGNLDVKLYVSDDGTNYVDVEDGSNPVFDYKLWEPGYTAIKNIKIENAGNLALKYKMNIKADSAVTGEYKLADVIDVYDCGENKPSDRSQLTNVKGTLSQLMSDENGAFYGNLKAGESTSMWVALKMQESADNNYQNLSIGNGISLYLQATQYTEENDGFGNNQYDAEATYSPDVWTGETPAQKPDSLQVDETTKTITVKNANDLLYLNKLANEVTFNQGYYWTVKLDADIDLANRPIDTIALNKWGHFDGQYHVISNVVMNEGQKSLFSDTEGISTGKDTIKNLTIDNITVYAPEATKVGALVGSTGAAISNVTVKNANITGAKAVGGLAGYAQSVTNCAVLDSTVTIPADGEKTVGGLVGYIIIDGKDGGTRTITGNKVENVTVAGPYNVGGMFGQAQGASGTLNITGNTVKDTYVFFYETEGYSAPEVGGAKVAARLVGSVNTDANTVTNVTVAKVTEINSANELMALGGKSIEGVIEITADIDLNGAAMPTIGAAYGKTLIVNGNGHTISNAKTAHTSHNGMKHHGFFYAYTDTTLTINDLKFENITIDATKDTERNYGAAVVVAFADGGSNVTLNNVDVKSCHVKNDNPDFGDEAAVYVGYQTGTLTMKNCDSTGCTVAGETDEKTGAFIGMVNGTATLTNCTTDLTIGACNRVAGTLNVN